MARPIERLVTCRQARSVSAWLGPGCLCKAYAADGASGAASCAQQAFCQQSKALQRVRMLGTKMGNAVFIGPLEDGHCSSEILQAEQISREFIKAWLQFRMIGAEELLQLFQRGAALRNSLGGSAFDAEEAGEQVLY